MGEPAVPNELLQNIQWEIKSEKDITQKDRDDIENLGKRPLALYLEDSKGPQAENLGSSAFAHASALSALKDAEKDKSPLSVVFARNFTGDLVGYSIVVLNPGNTEEQTKGTYLGVDMDQEKKGIGTQLLKKRIELLKEKGITKYRAGVRNKVLGLYDKLGINYDTQPHDNPNASMITVYIV